MTFISVGEECMVLQFPIAVGVESLAVVFFFGFAKSCQAEHVLLPI